MMDTNQLGRRNLSPVEIKLALGRRYNRSKKAKNDGGAGTPKTSKDQNDTCLENTAAKLATQHGVSFTRRNIPTNQNVLRINPDAVVGGARDSHGQGVFLNIPLQHAISLPCNTYATVFLIRLHSALEMA